MLDAADGNDPRAERVCRYRTAIRVTVDGERDILGLWAVVRILIGFTPSAVAISADFTAAATARGVAAIELAKSATDAASAVER